MCRQNKTIVFLGSSVTYGDNNYSMCEAIKEKKSYEIIKWAVPGTTLSDINENSYVSRFDKEVSHQKKCDCFVCQLSTNDAALNLPLGEISQNSSNENFNTKTIIGAIEYIILKVQNKWHCPIFFYTNTYTENENYQKMVNSLLELKRKWNFDIIDLWNDPEMRAIDKANYEKYMSDPVHPTICGYKEWWSPKFIEALSKVLK